MTANPVRDGVFHLASLDLDGAYDMVIDPMPMPGKLTYGRDPALFLIDGASRAPRRMARLLHEESMVGIRVTPPTERVRVRLTLIADPLSAQLWGMRDENVSAPPLHLDPEYDAPDVSTHHRLVSVWAQDRLRGTALLAYRDSDGELLRQRIVFEMDPDEVDDGLLMVEFAVPDHHPVVGGTDTLLERGPIGVCVGRLEVVPTGEVPPDVAFSSGRTVEGGTHTDPDTGFVVVNPVPGLGAPTLEVSASAPAPVGRRAMVKHPIRSSRALRARRDIPTTTHARVTSYRGETMVEQDLTVPLGGAATLSLPASDEPLYVELPGGPWHLNLRRG